MLNRLLYVDDMIVVATTPNGSFTGAS